MKKITDIDVNNKRVIVRCDLNVSIKNNKILSDDKIIASLETIKYLLEKKSKVIIMSHLGKVKKEEDKESNSLYIVYERLKEILVNTNIYFSKDTRGKRLEELVNNLNEKEILLIENTRFEDIDNNKESGNDIELSKYWASLGDVFINDAFGTSHRKHASNNGITKYIESGVGFLFQKEIEKLDVLIKPDKPFTVIMGGAKVEGKISLINNILKKCDHLLLGGGIANTFLSINNNIGTSLYSPNSKKEVEELLLKYKDKIILPIDAVVENNKSTYIRKTFEIKDNDTIYDIGPNTIDLYKNYINNSNTIFINGTSGMYEDERFEEGTKEILKASSSSKAKVVLGGGDALASANKFNIKEFYFMSTGGGATLDYIANENIACLEE